MPCYFELPISNYRVPTTSKIKCEGNKIRVENLLSYNVELYGCNNVIDLALLRGRGEELNWNDEMEIRRVYSEEICAMHVNYLVKNWSNNAVCNKNVSEKQPTCSLPMTAHVHHTKRRKINKSNTRMRRDDCIAFMRYFNVTSARTTSAHCATRSLGKSYSKKIAVQLSDPSIICNCNHIVRSTANEAVRKRIVEELEKGDALITMDFSLKLLPKTNIESQSAWFAKKGITFHCSHVLTVIDDEYYQHTLGCVVQECKQDSSSVSVFIDHMLRILSVNGISRVYFRSDNASSYHNASLFGSISSICNETGIECLGYFFSEAQDGKGAADRKISHAKRKSNDHVNGGGDGSTAAEIVHGLIQPTLLKCYSFYEIDITSSKNGKCTMKGIKSFSTFKFESHSIRVWRHAGIGSGLLFKKESLKQNEFTYIVRQQGGYLSQSEGFWGSLGKIDGEMANDQDDDKEEESEDNSNLSAEAGEERPLKYHCPELNCIAVFLTQLGLDNHQIIGKHQLVKRSETITDRALRIFSESIEKNRVVFERVPVNLQALEKTAKNITSGFSLFQRERGNGLIDDVAMRIEEYFHERRNAGRRADAKEIASIIRDLKNPDSSYMFSLRDCPRQGQAQTVISRLLREEAEGSTNGKEPNATKVGKVKNGKGRGRKRKLSEIDNSDDSSNKVIIESEESDQEEDCEEYAPDHYQEILADIQDEYEEIFL